MWNGKHFPFIQKPCPACYLSYFCFLVCSVIFYLQFENSEIHENIDLIIHNMTL